MSAIDERKMRTIQFQSLQSFWSIASLFAIVIALEFTTPSEYVFGYLYTGPILLANSRQDRLAIFPIVLVACGLTALNLFFPRHEPRTPASVANRLIAVMALAVTGWLSSRNQGYADAIAQTKAQLQAQQQLASMREDFASTLSHDLKTPILGAIETIEAFEKGNFGMVSPLQQQVLETMARSHHATLQLVETLLDVYRNDAEGLKLQLSAVNLADLAEEAIATLIHLSATRRVYISLRYGESHFRRSLWVRGDPLQLRRVFINLLTNGINHSPRGGKVEIILDSFASYQRVKVVDTGSGIAANELPYLFERFYQGHSDRQAKGSGLGLYLSRQIIEAHGGTIWAESQLPKGALFGFRLPAIPQHETSPTG